MWLYLFLFRLANALILCTSFGPDEYWQSLEVAHRWVFGYGHLTWEWEPCIALRGVLHPGIFALYYAALLHLGIDIPWMVAFGPRLLQSLFASWGDLATYRCAQTLFGESTARWTLAVQLSSWFLFYCMVRTYSNSLESVLLTLALESWMQPGGQPHTRAKALIFGALSVALRPTSAVFWLILIAHEITGTLFAIATQGDVSERFSRLVRHVLIPGFLSVIVILPGSWMIDRCWYGNWVLVPWNFFKFNLLHDHGALYGSHPWHWYFSEGLAVTLGTFLPFVALGVWAAFCGSEPQSRLRGPIIAVVGSIAMMSAASHKEYRMLLPFLPFTSVLAGIGLEKISKLSGKRLGTLIVAVFLPQIVAASFFALVHQRGAEAVMTDLRQKPPGPSGAFFLTPCHATPLHSHVHLDIPLDYLDCSPGTGSPRDRFFSDPLKTLGQLFPHASHTSLNLREVAVDQDGGASAIAGLPVVPCLAHRYILNARQLPNMFVVWGSLIDREPLVEQWLVDNEYALQTTVQDGIWSEGPYGMEMYPRFFVFRRIP